MPQISRRPSVHETHDSAVLRQAEFLYYLYSFAILGTTLRLFLGRLFGSDCESPGEIEDFMSPLSEKICVTSGGTTLQHGGALFLDLPANMLGSFVMGIVSSLYPEGGRKGSKLPWLRKTHPLQNHQGIHHAIKVGFCGSLTTFSSWNSQMVTMMDGTYTQLGPQVVPAIFGYIIGMASSLYAFSMGGKVHEWLYDWSNRRYQNNDDNHENDDPSLQSIDHDEEQPTSWDSEDSTPQPHNSKSAKGNKSTPKDEAPRTNLTSIKDKTPINAESMSTWFHKLIPLCISVSILVAYGIGADERNMQFFRELFACSLLTPVGVHLRWKLSALNGRGIPCGSSRKYEWMPWGTFTCNIIRCIPSAHDALYPPWQR
jgi:fluoride ion exporter CrcB/FEX